MKAIRVHDFGEPEMMRLEDVPDPRPGPGEVVIRVRAIGVNPVDTYIRTGSYAMKPALPYTPGSDAAGVVEAVGEGVDELKSGARVYTSGTISGAYAERVSCKVSQVRSLPDNVSFSQGAGVWVPYGTAYCGLFLRARAVPGEVVFVHGASGGVGTAAVQMARAAGMTVIGTAGTEKGRTLVREQGGHYVLDHHHPDYLRRLPELTKGRGVDVVLEMLANVNLAKDLEIVAQRGRIVVIGNRGTIEINPRAAMARNASIVGMTLPNTPPHELAIIHAALAAGLENRTMRPVVGRELPLGEAARAHRLVMEPGSYGKIILVP